MMAEYGRYGVCALAALKAARVVGAGRVGGLRALRRLPWRCR